MAEPTSNFDVKVNELRGKVEGGLISREAAIAKLHNWCSIYDFKISDGDLERVIDVGTEEFGKE